MQSRGNALILYYKVEGLTFCTFCGKVLSKDYYFCPYCGTQCRDDNFEEITENGFKNLEKIELQDGLSRLNSLESMLDSLDTELTRFLSFKMI